jgi:type II secretory pathway pseudopilin PulG
MRAFVGETATLNSTNLGLMAFLFTFGAAMVAIAIRGKLPSHHVEGDSKDAVKLVLGLIATLTAMVLGLLISSSHTAYDAQQAELQQMSAHLFQIDRILVEFGPDAADQRALLRKIVASDVARVWPTDGTPPTIDPLLSEANMISLFEGIAGLSPKTELQKFTKARAMELLAGAGETRHLMVEQSQGALSWPFLIVLVSWQTVLFFGFGLFARFNATVVVALLVGSLSVAGAIFLILEMNHPYSGWMQISSAPLRDVLTQMSR